MNRKHARSYRLRDFRFDCKAVSDKDDGLFSGYASVFGNVDAYNEVVAPGAFRKSLDEIAARGDPLPALWQHKYDEPVGGYDKLEEDANGLKVEGFLLTDAVQRAREAYALIKRRVVSGLSIGFYVVSSSFNEKTNIRTLTELDLVEVSIVTVPANDDARIDAVKAKLVHGQLPTLREFEKLLREQGFTKSQAALVAARGLKHLLDRGDPETVQGMDLAAALRDITIPSL
jgi:HK97 family phage prohead protease